MCATRSGDQETVCEDADVTAEQVREERDIRTAGAGEPGTDFLFSGSLRSTPAPAHLALALWYDLGCNFCLLYPTNPMKRSKTVCFCVFIVGFGLSWEFVDLTC